MEIILILIGILVIGFSLFILIEYPYYLVSIFVFLHLYDFNFELPIPLDLRGILSVSLFLRLIVFDKRNLRLIINSLSNKFFIIIIFFSLYVSLSDYFNATSLLKIIRLNILNFVALLLGFITIMRGQGKKTIVLAILMAGLFSTADLIFSYLTKGSLIIKRIVDVYITGEHLTFNHNFFGAICGHALITIFLLHLTKGINKIIAYSLIIIFVLGIMVSTSRMTFLSVFLTIIILLLTNKSLQLNIKKIFISGLIGFILIGVVSLSYSYILSAMNIKSEFAEQIHYRLIEEPLSVLEGNEIQKFKGTKRVQGTMRWRYYKILRDMDKFSNQTINKFLFGFGTGGYSKIGQIEYRGGKEAFQYSSHNFYVNTLSEKGIIGLVFFFIFFLLLIYNILKMAMKGQISFSLVYLLVYMLIYTFGGDPKLTGKFAFLLYGTLIADYILATDLIKNNEINVI